MWRNTVSSITIGAHRIAAGAPLFVVAEIGVNHGGSLSRALALVDAAAAAGASAIKLQTIVAADLVAPSSLAPQHVKAASLVDFFSAFELDERAHGAVVARARDHGLAALATPFSLDAVDMLERVGIDGYKIASGDVTFEQLIRRCARTRKPLVISTGMSHLDEVSHAVGVARGAGATDIALLHCVSAYPVPDGSEQLASIRALGESFDVPVGLSDHSVDAAFSLPLAVAMGASLYERHILQARGDGSVDEAVSSTPDELARLVALAARATTAIGSTVKQCSAAEAPNMIASRRALYARRSLKAGAAVTSDDIVALRPAIGLAPVYERELLGATLTRDVAAGTPFFESDIDSYRLLRRTRAVA